MTPAAKSSKAFSQTGRSVVCCVLLCVAVAGTYADVVHFDYINLDDNLYVYDNPHVRSGLTSDSVKWAFTDTSAGLWIPATWLSFMAGVQIHGLAPGWHHVTNAVLHLANVLLLFAVLSQSTHAFWRSAAVAALFALHPVHVESVAWITERKDVLSTFFLLLTLWGYCRYVEKPGLLRYMAVGTCFILALWAKPSVMTLPFVLMLLDYWPLERVRENAGNPVHVSRWVPLAMEKLPLFALAVMAGAITYWSVNETGTMHPMDMTPVSTRIIVALISYVRYMGKLFCPVGLAVLYPFPKTVSWIEGIGAAMLLIGISWIVFRQARHRPYLPAGWLWFLGTLVPVIGLVSAGPQSMADRFAYVPFIGLYVAVVWTTVSLLPSRPASRAGLAVAGLVLLAALAVTTWHQVHLWQNSIRLYRHTIANTTDNWLIHNNLGFALYNKGQTDAAIEQFHLALGIRPDYIDAHINLGLALKRLERYTEAAGRFQTALRLNPDHAAAHNNLALVLEQLGRPENAEKHYRQALRIRPEYLEAHINLANLMARAGRVGQARDHYLAAVRLRPDHAPLHNHLGIALFKSGAPDRARIHFQEAIRLVPEFVNAHINLGNTLVMAGRPEQAITHYRTALRLNPDATAARYYLGVARLLTGEPERAATHFRHVFAHHPHFTADGTRWCTTVAVSDAIAETIATLRGNPDQPSTGTP